MEKDIANLTTLVLCLVIVELLVYMFMAKQVLLLLTPAMFIFGDSLIDSGNNNYIPTIAKADYFPYRVDFGLPTGRFCNGLTAADYAALYLGLPLIPPYLSALSKGRNILNGLNYASAAAGILNETGQHFGARIPFNAQISQFETTIRLHLQLFFENPDMLNQYLAKSVFLINVGSNNYINNYLQPNRKYDFNSTKFRTFS
ncbi:hypothetical protein Q3G72_006126 [Acer saccharum]|nr:hypothetical protein Q3G72_006126 [Acer saccharum]